MTLFDTTAIAMLFELSDPSKLPSQQFVDNLSKKLIICFQHLDVLNDIEPAVPKVIEI